jgi:hypothetical protein
MNPNGHDETGRFAPGNPGGPGRPRRAVERDYLGALSENVTLDDWKAVVTTAVKDAKSGDAKARDWLAKYLLGDKPPALADIDADATRPFELPGTKDAQAVAQLLIRQINGVADSTPATAEGAKTILPLVLALLRALELHTAEELVEALKGAKS